MPGPLNDNIAGKYKVAYDGRTHVIADVTEQDLEQLWLAGISFRYGTIRQGRADVMIDKDEDYNKALELIGSEQHRVLPSKLP